MKVIERKPWSHAFTCRGCGSKLEAEPEDVRVGQFGSMGDYDTRHYVDCSVCGTTHTIDDAKIPPDIEKMARQKSNHPR